MVNVTGRCNPEFAPHKSHSAGGLGVYCFFLSESDWRCVNPGKGNEILKEVPETRSSLLLRLKSEGDEEAWETFVEIYRPLVYRLARQRGFQEADADELSQEAMVAVAGAIERWAPRVGRGSFRRWLFRIARNMMINAFQRTRPGQRGIGGTTFRVLVEQQPDATEEERAWFADEYRQEVFRWASERVRHEFRDSTWEAFWRTSVKGEGIKDAAEELGISVGAVYAARSRVMARLKREVAEIEE